MELIVRLRRHGYETGRPARIEFVPDPVEWAETPTTLRALGRQRERWQRGFSDVMWRHRRLLLNPRYGVLGLVETGIHPVRMDGADRGGHRCGRRRRRSDPRSALATVRRPVLLAGLRTGDAPVHAGPHARGALVRPSGRARDRALLTVWAVLENFGFRQLTVVWRLHGIMSFVRGKKSWGKVTRKGFSSAEDPGGSVRVLPAPINVEDRRPVGVSAFDPTAPARVERSRSPVP